ncbi:PucR family transcriptional regulator [Rhodococcus tibetensis]|uniref:Helix-turn-helix domain-containing protein n=1 Tax=Rhodococcus tibetensis TaxID=2965064 RepID=A0ABT1QCC2_9NOCA|nr:helix-turn-helix domain-containing protein [Rhodococcus sp. FXJ9.536]MCQ4119913.1 helix-turn-helix domain-containing protein [Rhodococcus sp. FXJ9.536]
MADNNSETGLGIMMAGQPASEPLRNFRSLARHLVSRFATEIASPGTAPGKQSENDVTEVTVHCLQLGIQMFDTRSAPADGDLDPLRTIAAQWAREGVPLKSVLHVYHEGIRRGWDLVVSKARAEDLDDVVAGSLLLLALVESVTVAATSSYMAEVEALTSERNSAAQAMVTALLSGRNPVSLARQSGIGLVENYVVIGLSVPPYRADTNPKLPEAVGIRRRTRRVQAAISDACGGAPLALLSEEGGTILLPGTPTPAELQNLIRRLGEASEADVTAAVAPARIDRIPSAADEVHELLDLVHQLSRPQGLYRMEDLALEFQLTRHGPGRTHLASLLEPLDGSPELVETLEVHIGHDLNRQRTAKKMHVHANTVDYRLKRVAQLTGFDPTRPSGLRQIQAALIARRLEQAHPRQ